MITVLSTAFRAPTRDLCIDSVSSQTLPRQHIYIEASEQNPPRAITENVWRACRELPADEIVVWLDGDDHLPHPHVLERVRAMYDDGADCTYGSFRFSDGRGVKLKAYDDPKNCRRDPWLATHLRTFRAGLVAAIPPGELMHNGEWIDMACDHAVMFPVLELARKPMFCPEVLCVYHYETSWEHRFTPADRAREKAMVEVLRARMRLTSSP